MTKILVTLNIPTIEMSFDVYLPINKKIGTIKKYLLDAIKELTDSNFNISLENLKLIDKETGIEYENNVYLNDSQIKNGSQIIMF